MKYIFLLLALFLLFPRPAKCAIVINEINYNPQGAGDLTEFIELLNTGSAPVHLDGWFLSNAVSYTFPEQTVILPGEFCLVAKNPAAFYETYPLARHVYGPFDNNSQLDNGGEQILLITPDGDRVTDVTYDDDPPWPSSPDGDGHTLELSSPALSAAGPTAWKASRITGGTPGAINSTFDASAIYAELSRSPLAPAAADTVDIYADVKAGSVQQATLYYFDSLTWKSALMTNSSGSVWHYTLPPAPDKTWVSYYILFVSSNADSYKYPPNGYSYYQVTDSPVASDSLVINEIMYHSSPTVSTLSYEYVELLNTSTTAIDVAGYTFESVNLPLTSLIIPPGGYLVLSDAPAVLQDVYGPVSPLIACDISLDNAGETLHLYDQNGRELCQVPYGVSGEWPSSPNGTGPSLELRSSFMDLTDPASWLPSAGLGTPGSRNSAAVSGAFGRFSSVTLNPPEPEAFEPVHLTTRLTASLPVQSAEIIIHTGTWHTTAIQLYDDGTHGDGSAGDGVYGGEIPGYPELTYVWFYLRARLNDSTELLYPPPQQANPVNLRVRLSGSGINSTVSPTRNWQVSTNSGNATSSELYMYLSDPGNVLVDDVRITYGSTQYIPNGTFDRDDGGWHKNGNHGGSWYDSSQGYYYRGCEQIVATGSGSSEQHSFNRYTFPALNENGTTYRLMYAYRLPYERWLWYHTGPHSYSNVYINELMAQNSATPVNGLTDFSDWIELYNGNAFPLPAGGMRLSDNPGNPDKWQIPAGIVIPPYGFLIIRADGDGNGLHTSYKLAQEGESLSLYSPAGILLDSISFGSQFPDIAFGRVADGAPQWSLLSTPTPGKPNRLDLYSGLHHTAVPETSHPGGMYYGTQYVTLSVTSPAARVYYTTDGSLPGTNATLYTIPIVISTSTAIRARSFEPGFLPSAVATWTLLIDEQSSLPLVSMVAEPDKLWDPEYGIYINEIKDVEIPMSIAMYEPDGSEAFSINAGAQIFGLNIFRFAQKPFSIFTRGKYGSDPVNYQIFPDTYINVFKNFVMRNGGDDWPDAHFRDGMSVKLLDGRMAIARQAYRPCLGFLNGRFWGIYNLREKVNEHYLAAHFGADPAAIDFLESDLGIPMQVIQGSSDHYTAMLDFIAANDMTLPANYAYIKTQMDVDSLLELLIAEVYTDNSSWYHNRKWWRPQTPEGKWRWILFDLERGFHDPARNRVSDIYNNFDLFRMLCENPEFKRDFCQKLAAHLSSTFEAERVMHFIDEAQAVLSNDMPRHVAQWSSEGGIASMAAWESEVSGMRDFARGRPSVVYDNVKSLFGISGVCDVFLRATPSEAGFISAQGVTLPDTLTKARFFTDMPLTLAALPKPGYHFVQWNEYPMETVTLFPAGSVWRYNDSGANLGTAWYQTGYDDSSWSSGSAQFGYGDGDETTVLNYGPDANNKYITYYFRTTFSIPDPEAFIDVQLELLKDDGAVVYLNGSELLRSNMPETPVDYLTLAGSAVSGSNESNFTPYSIPPSMLNSGDNLLAVEIHQADPTSSDVSFDLALNTTRRNDAGLIVLGYNPVLTREHHSNTFITAEFASSGLAMIPEQITTQSVFRATGIPYYASGTIAVHSNASLQLGPGVELRMPPGASIYVQGALALLGSSNNPVRLTAQSNTWGSLVLLNMTTTAMLSNVVISGATAAENTLRDKAAVSCYKSDVFLYNVVITNAPYPFFAQYGRIQIRNCLLHSDAVCDMINVKHSPYVLVEGCELYGGYAPDTDGVDFDDVTFGIIRANTVRDFLGSNNDGLDIGGSQTVMIESNLILRCADKGISIGQGAHVFAAHNIIAGCQKGVGLKDLGSFGTIINNTIYDTLTGVSCYEKHGSRGGAGADVHNTIILRSSADSIFFDEFSSVTSSYCLSDRDQLSGIGNLFADPLLTDPDNGDFSLTYDSPCINAGDPDSPYDPDGTRADIGALYLPVPEPGLFMALTLAALVVLRSRPFRICE